MMKFFASLLLFSLASCSHSNQPIPESIACQKPNGIPTGDLLLFGEMHGSKEAPAVISEITCALSGSNNIAVGIEVPSADQALIDAYLQSDGTSADRARLISSDFWQKGKDGRSSIAMLRLIEDIRILKKSGRSVQLFAFDDQPNTDLERNVAIANGIRRFHNSHKNTKIIALMGNIHAMQDSITTNEGPLIPSGAMLSDLKPISILITYPSGTTWACMPDCGVQKLTPRSQTTGETGFKEGAPLGGYSFSYQLHSISASPPATQ